MKQKHTYLFCSRIELKRSTDDEWRQYVMKTVACKIFLVIS